MAARNIKKFAKRWFNVASVTLGFIVCERMIFLGVRIKQQGRPCNFVLRVKRSFKHLNFSVWDQLSCSMKTRCCIDNDERI